MNYGIRVKNPLTKPVKVQIWQGKQILIAGDVIVDPGRTKFIALDNPGEFEVRTMIVDNVFASTHDELGPASWKILEHQDVAKRKPVKTQPAKEEELVGRSLSDMFKDLAREEVPV